METALGNEEKLMRETKQAFFSEFYGRVWDSIIDNSSPKHNLTNAILIKGVKDNITSLLPGVNGIFREVDDEFRSLQRNGVGNMRDNFIKKATDTTIKIVAKHISLEELERRLKTHEERE